MPVSGRFLLGVKNRNRSSLDVGEVNSDAGCDGRCSRNFRVLARSIAALYRKCRAALWSVLRQCRPRSVESAPDANQEFSARSHSGVLV